jgi:hypothetical protein
MTTIRSFTSLEQSRKLAEILPIESADMSWVSNGLGKPFARTIPIKGDPEELCGCWSLAALRNLLPAGIKINENTYLFGSHNTFDKCWVYRYYNEDDTSYLYCKNINEVDACVAMIEKLKELNLL